MSRPLRKSFLIAFTALFCLNILNAQMNAKADSTKLYNTKSNYVFLNYSFGGGDYPFAGLGLNLSRQLSNGKTMAGVGLYYIGDTYTTNPETYQIFPIMADIRQLFMESPDGRFAFLVIADAGYVVRINGHDSNDEGSFVYQNGWAINPGISFRFNIFKNMGIMFDITWLHHGCARVWEPPVEKKDHVHWDFALLRGHVFF